MYARIGSIMTGRLFSLVLIAYAAIGYDLVTHKYGWYIWVPLVFLFLERILFQAGLWLTQRLAAQALTKLLGAMQNDAPGL